MNKYDGQMVPTYPLDEASSLTAGFPPGKICASLFVVLRTSSLFEKQIFQELVSIQLGW